MIDPFEEDLSEDINIDHIYNIIYGSLLTYYKDIFLNYRIIKKDDIIYLLKIIDEDYEIVCYFNIDQDFIVVNYQEQGQLKNERFKLEYDLNDNKFKIYKIFKTTFDKLK